MTISAMIGWVKAQKHQKNIAKRTKLYVECNGTLVPVSRLYYAEQSGTGERVAIIKMREN